MGRRGKSERNRSEVRGPQKLSCRFKPGELLRFVLRVPDKQHFRGVKLGINLQN